MGTASLTIITTAHAYNKMALMNTTVVCTTEKKTIVPWMIKSVEPPNAIFRDFFEEHLLQLLNCEEKPRHLEETFVGSRKDALDKVDCDLVLKDVTATFGPFVKYVVVSANKFLLYHL